MLSTFAGDALAPKEEESTTSDPTHVEDTMYMYFPDRLPAQRQLHYQLCDIMDSQLQKVIHNNDGKEKECTVSAPLASYTSWRKTWHCKSQIFHIRNISSVKVSCWIIFGQTTPCYITFSNVQDFHVFNFHTSLAIRKYSNFRIYGSLMHVPMALSTVLTRLYTCTSVC